MTDSFSLDHIWGRKLAGIDFADVFRPFQQSDIDYLLHKYPFIQAVNTTGLFDDIKLEIIEAQSGWEIFYYGDALCTSRGEQLFNDGDYINLIQKALLEEEDTDTTSGSGDETNQIGKGTIIKQVFDTAYDIVMLAMKFGWGGIEIVDGTSFMKAMLWLIAKASDVYVEGYTPTEEDEKRLKQLAHKAKIAKELAKAHEFAFAHG